MSSTISLQNLLPREQTPIGARHNMVDRQVIPWEKLVNKLNLCDKLNLGKLYRPKFLMNAVSEPLIL